MIYREYLFLIVFILLLVALAAFAAVSVVQAQDRQKKFQSRVDLAVMPSIRRLPEDDKFLLTKTVTRSELLKQQAASFIGVDLQQAETYPIRWWLIPPMALVPALVIVEMVAHIFDSLASIILLIGLPVAWFLINKFIFNWLTNRRNAKLLEQFPDALGTVVRCVRVGIPVGEAMRTVARDAQEPTKAEFTILADKVSIGIPIDIALRELSERIKITEYQFFATALSLQARSGGGITQTLETLADVIRKRVALKARGFALTSEARTSALILSLLPFVAGTAIFVMQREYIMLLFTTKSGQSILGAAILLMGIGMGIIQYMISNVLK